MRTLWTILKRTVFWSYERGTWQFDLAVVAILVFVLLTPRRWFNDQPKPRPSSASDAPTLLVDDGATQKYWIQPGALERGVAQLHERGLTVVKIEPTADARGAVTGYQVHVKR
jgi:hypothetical protein